MTTPDGESRESLQQDRDSIWTIPLSWRALYFGLFTAYALAGIGFLIWYHVFEYTEDSWQQTILSITQGIGVNTVGAAGLALLTIEGPQTIMVVAHYLRKKLIEPLEEKRRIEAERRRAEAEERLNTIREASRAAGLAEGRVEGRVEGLAEGRAEGHAEGEAQARAAWEAWNERRLAAEAGGESFDEPPPGTSNRGEGE